MLIAVRHGATSFNTAKLEKSRGWLPVPLSLEGMKTSREVAESLEAVEDVYAVYTSDLVRAVQAAEEIAQVLSMELQPREELRDWDTGNLAGEIISKNLPIIHDHIDHPNKILPGGESFQRFLDRCTPFLHELVESDNICIAVTHNRVITLIKALSINKGKHPDTATLKKKAPIEPSGLMIVRSDWKITFQTKEG